MTYYGMVVGKQCTNGHITNHRVSGWCNDQVENAYSVTGHFGQDPFWPEKHGRFGQKHGRFG